MNDEDKKMQIATFRFGLISEFVTGVRLGYGEKEKLLKDKLARSYDIPFSNSSRLSRSTLEKWVNERAFFILCKWRLVCHRISAIPLYLPRFFPRVQLIHRRLRNSFWENYVELAKSGTSLYSVEI